MKSSMRIELYLIPLVIATLSLVAGLFFKHSVVGLIFGIVGLNGCALAWIAVKVGTAEIERGANAFANKIGALIRNKAKKPDEE